MDCKSCGSANRPRARYCAVCGAEMNAGCRQCGAGLPPDATACPACGCSVIPAGNADLPESAGPAAHERRLVTVFFADFEGFTAFSENRDAEEVHDYMGSLWSRITPLIEARGGTLEKYIGDAIVALFGVKQVQEDSPAHAVRAALAVQASLREMATRGKQKPLPMRIAINTGSLVIQPTGMEGEFRATGETLNVASRLQSHAPSGGVLISHDTFRHVEGLFEFQPLPPITVKGKTEPIRAYVVLRAVPRAEACHLRGVEGVKTELIGREAEMDRLRTIFHEVVASREPRVVTVLGDAGLGKSRLVREFQKWAESFPGGVRLFKGRATAEMRGSSFALFRDLLAAQFDIQDSDTLFIARSKMETGVASVVKDSGTTAEGRALPSVVAHFVGQLLRLDFSQSPYLEGLLQDPEQMRQRAFHYAGQFFAAATQPASEFGRPSAPAALLILDDIQWGDDGSLDLITHLARSCPGAPLLIICLARPTLHERRPDWGLGLATHTWLNLSPLPETASRTMVSQVLRHSVHVPEQLLDRVVRLAEGNPFYLEEALKMFIEQGVIIPGTDHWMVEPQRLADTALPVTLTGVLQARLDSLAPREREVAQRASVVGRVFWNTVLDELNPAAEVGPAPVGSLSLTRAQIAEALDALARKQIIVKRSTTTILGTCEFAFTHELFRHVAYETVLKKRRRHLHAQVARWLIAAAGDRAGETAVLVAGHLEKGDLAVEAADWFARAGQEAAASHTPAAAAELYSRALALLPPDSAETAPFRRRRLDWHQALAENLGAQSRYAEGAENYQKMLVFAEQFDLLSQARAWNGLAFMRERDGDKPGSLAAADRAFALAGTVGARDEQVKALHLKAWAYYRLADAAAVLALAQQTLALCVELGDHSGRARSFKLMGVAHLQLGHYEEASGFFQRGLEIWQATGDLRNAASMWSNQGEAARAGGDFHAAELLYQKALSIARQVGSCESELIYLNNLAAARLGQDQLREAEADLREVIARAHAGRPFLSETYCLLAEARLKQGRLADAIGFAENALRLAQASSNLLDLAAAWRLCALVYSLPAPPEAESAARPAPRDPATCFRESLNLLERAGASGEQARTLRLWSEWDRENGRLVDAEARLAAAAALAPPA